MYNYKEDVKASVREWVEENREQWEDLDRTDAEQVIYDGTWAEEREGYIHDERKKCYTM